MKRKSIVVSVSAVLTLSLAQSAFGSTAQSTAAAGDCPRVLGQARQDCLAAVTSAAKGKDPAFQELYAAKKKAKKGGKKKKKRGGPPNPLPRPDPLPTPKGPPITKPPAR